MKKVAGEQKEELLEGWKWVRLEEIADVTMGLSPNGASYNKEKKGLPLLNGAADIKQGKIIPSQYTSKPERVVAKGDLLLCIRATIGNAIFSDGNYCIGRGLAGIRVKTQLINPFYLKYWIETRIEPLVTSANGGIIKGIKKEDLTLMPIPLPPKLIQDKIVAKLEKQMVQIEIMKKEAEKESIAVDNLFESIIKKEVMINFKNFPKYWSIFKIEDICELKTGGTPSKSHPEFFGGDIKWMVSGDINKEYIYDIKGRITRAGYDNSNARILPINSVLIALNGQGKTRGTVAVLKTEATCNQSVIAFVPKNKDQIDFMYLYYYLKGCYQKLRNLTGDNERSGLSMRVLKPFFVVVPPLEIQREIVKKLEKLRNEVEKIHENINLQLSNISTLSSAVLNETFAKYEIYEEN